MTSNATNEDIPDKHNDETGSLAKEDIQPYVNMSSFRKQYLRPEDPPLTFRENCKNHLKSFCSCKKEQRSKMLNKRLPFIRIMKKYKVKSDLPNDILAGLTVGIMQLPQGMAYAMLADMPPVVGLYMSFFPVLIYFFLGTSKQVSMGTVAVVSLMTGSVVSRLVPAPELSANVGFNPNISISDVFATNVSTTPSSLNITSMDPSGELMSAINAKKIAVAGSLCLLTGLFQILLGVLKMGKVTTYMSDSLISGFTTGAAVHVFTSQVKYIFGLKIPRAQNLFQVVFTYKSIFENIVHTNVATLVISLVCIVILYLVKVQINQRFKSKLKIPLPIELVVVVIGTVLSYFFHFEEKFQTKVVGDIPAGIPAPVVPSFYNVTSYVGDAFIIAVVAFAQSVSLAALMAKKHKYTIDPNQELIAYGAGSVFGSFFSCYPFAASVSRSSVQDSAGGRSQIASMVSASMVLIVILWIGPLFQSLPNCILSAIIVVALRSMFLQMLELPKIWRISKYDFSIWMVSFVAVVVLHVDLGLLVGILFSFYTVVLRSQRARAAPLEKVCEAGVFADSNNYTNTESYSGVRVVDFSAPLYFANGDIFVKHVRTLTGIAPDKIRKQRKRNAADLSRRNSKQDLVDGIGQVQFTIPEMNGEIPKQIATVAKTIESQIDMPKICSVHYIVIDCSAMSFVDSVGVKIFRQLIDDYKTVDISVYLASVRDDVWSIFEETEFLEKYRNSLFLTVQDAVTAAMIGMRASDDNTSEINTYI